MMSKNQRAPWEGYLFSLEDGRAIAEGWSRSEADADSWRRAYESLKTETEDALNELKTLNKQIKDEARKMRRKTNAKSRRNALLWFIIGGAAGAVIYNNR